jgi:ADP-ribose pyrophosphatase
VSRLSDRSVPGLTIGSRASFDGAVWSVRTDTVDLAPGVRVERDVVDHPGAVAVVAVDDEGRVVLVEQYRHPVEARLWELPAGLLDRAGEPMHLTAARELAEEAGIAADGWWTLVDLYLSPGGSSERMRIFLAERLSPAPAPPGFVAAHEEADLVVRRVALTDVVAAIHAGSLHNAALVAGVLAASAALTQRSLLRPADAPWAAVSG